MTVLKQKPKRSKNKRQRVARRTPRIISAGVINGRAINLVKPLHPGAARVCGAYGAVVVETLTDEQGDVVGAKALSGHLFLRAASVAAARQSKFEPYVLNSGVAVRIRGVIAYTFLPGKFNWLEVGYVLQVKRYYSAFYSLDNLKELLPGDYEEERQLIQAAVQNLENEESVRQSVIALLESRLADNAKERWLFSVGRSIAKTWSIANENDKMLPEVLQEFDFLIQTAPDFKSNNIVEELQQISLLLKDKQFFYYDVKSAVSKGQQALNRIVERMPVLGNCGL